VGELRRALGFLTALGRPAAPAPSALGWFPAVGLGLGAALGALWWGAARAWPAGVAAALVVAADLAATGLLHADGLADAADGLLAPLDPDRRLQAMADPHLGSFGAVAVAATLLARFAALAALHPSVLLLAGLWCASRTAMAVVAASVPYARGSSGLAWAFLPGAGGGRLAWAVGAGGGAACLGCLLAWRPGPGAAVLAAAASAMAGVTWAAVRRVGGFTGDVLGAAGVLGETAGLVVAAVRW
jgi:adenosylcobinamide-GDP ribazoletransferase